MRNFLLMAGIALFASCSNNNNSKKDEPKNEVPPMPEWSFPALYSGTLPCADCEGIRYSLDLRADSSYAMRMAYLGTADNKAFDEMGIWEIKDGRLILDGGREAKVMFAALRADSLTKLDLNGNPVETQLNYTLVREAGYQPLAVNAMLSGMFIYMADAAIISLCFNGKSYPVAMEGGYLQAERAYTGKNLQGAPALVIFEGGIVPRPKTEGDDTQETVVIGTFLRLSTTQNCDGEIKSDAKSPAKVESKEVKPTATAPQLRDKPWRLISLGMNRMAIPTEKGKAPHMLLATEGNRVAGFAGCNRFFGAYEVKGSSLTFGKMGMTMMACEDMKIEGMLTKMFEQVHGYELIDDAKFLSLKGENGRELARFVFDPEVDR